MARRDTVTADRAVRQILVMLAVCFAPIVASAHILGIAGFSGQQQISQPAPLPPVPLYCSNAGNGCHVTNPGMGTRPPLVRFEGPTQVDPGSQSSYTFVITSQSPTVQIQAGLDIAASGGTLGIVLNEQEEICSIQRQPGGFVACPNATGIPITVGGEITHTGPKNNDANGETRWPFTWTAPTTPGVYVLFGAGNSVNGMGDFQNDEAQITTLMIDVGSAPTPTPIALPCAGDCNGDRMVSISELITCVNIDLGSVALTACPVCSSNGQTVVIADLVAAVNRALSGC
jgi:hypothetical protein